VCPVRGAHGDMLESLGQCKHGDAVHSWRIEAGDLERVKPSIGCSWNGHEFLKGLQISDASHVRVDILVDRTRIPLFLSSTTRQMRSVEQGLHATDQVSWVLEGRGASSIRAISD